MTVSNQLPERLGRYRVLGRVARGGMAEILLGRLEGPSGFRRPVVLKRILREFAHAPRFIDALRDEARISAAISHANVVSVHELCEEDGEVFLVMEHLTGVSVRELMSRGSSRNQLSPLLAAWIVAEGCAGLQAAHDSVDARGLRLGVVHRDISLDNLFVTVDGDVKVLDFGIASAVRRQSYTLPGEVKGKVAYMAPEQLLGQQTTPRTDIFAMGVVLFEVSTAQRLFRGPDGDQIRQALSEGRIPDPRTVVDGYPDDLAEICMRALRSDPAERFATATEMRGELLGSVHNVPTTRGPRDDLGALVRSAFSDRLQRERERWTLLVTPSNDAVQATQRDAPVEKPPAVEGARPVARDTVPAKAIALHGHPVVREPPPARLQRTLILSGLALVSVVIATVVALRPASHSDEPATPAAVIVVPAATTATGTAAPHAAVAPKPAIVDEAALAPPPKRARKKHHDEETAAFPSFD